MFCDYSMLLTSECLCLPVMAFGVVHNLTIAEGKFAKWGYLISQTPANSRLREERTCLFKI